MSVAPHLVDRFKIGLTEKHTEKLKIEVFYFKNVTSVVEGWGNRCTKNVMFPLLFDQVDNIIITFILNT